MNSSINQWNYSSVGSVDDSCGQSIQGMQSMPPSSGHFDPTQDATYNYYNQSGVDPANASCSWPKDVRYLIYPNAHGYNGQGTNSDAPAQPIEMSVSSAEQPGALHTFVVPTTNRRDATYPVGSHGNSGPATGSRYQTEHESSTTGYSYPMSDRNDDNTAPTDLHDPASFSGGETSVVRPLDGHRDTWPYDNPNDDDIKTHTTGNIFDDTAIDKHDFTYVISHIEIRDSDLTNGKCVHTLKDNGVTSPIDIQLLGLNLLQAQPVISNHNNFLKIRDLTADATKMVHTIIIPEAIHAVTPPTHTTASGATEQIRAMLLQYVNCAQLLETALHAKIGTDYAVELYNTGLTYNDGMGGGVVNATDVAFLPNSVTLAQWSDYADDLTLTLSTHAPNHTLGSLDRNDWRKWKLRIRMDTITAPVVGFELMDSPLLSQLGMSPQKVEKGVTDTRVATADSLTRCIDLSIALKTIAVDIDPPDGINGVNGAAVRLRFPTTQKVVELHKTFQDPLMMKARMRKDYMRPKPMETLTVNVSTSANDDAQPFNLEMHTLYLTVAVVYLG